MFSLCLTGRPPVEGTGSSAVIRDLPGWPGRAEGALGKREKRDGAAMEPGAERGGHEVAMLFLNCRFFAELPTSFLHYTAV
ncbi:hypothetical protein B0H67DRAFT_577013 [Lasiosphaeris hirsuta]|uniref:Uncharacterized protein n=1 Tax=Lasiosphaeris hirsuta TaxID=260670 RepID=A0AA40ARL1_9PEZI|nr:hypothetical protein B0H67DRAFT_577013 [Lasiosphaeris hirsuta]